jgi:hypothetical protein
MFYKIYFVDVKMELTKIFSTKKPELLHSGSLRTNKLSL